MKRTRERKPLQLVAEHDNRSQQTTRMSRSMLKKCLSRDSSYLKAVKMYLATV